MLPTYFANQDLYAEWKQNEQLAIEKVLLLTGYLHDRPVVEHHSLQPIREDAIGQDDPSPLIMLSVVEATGLYPKDQNRTSNPYCVVAFDGINHLSQTVIHDLNPRYT